MLCWEQYTRCPSHWPRGLRRRPVAAHLLGLRDSILPAAWVSVSCECCVLLQVEASATPDHSSRGVLSRVSVSL